MSSLPKPSPSPAPGRSTPAPALRLGYVPLVHAAPLWVAHHLGLYRREGLSVRLYREVGWATVREKLLGGELEACQTLAPMPLAMTLGLGSVRCECVSALILNLHGNCVVLSRRRWPGYPVEAGGSAFRPSPPPEPFVFGIVYPHSAQRDILHRWLLEAGLVPDRDFRLVVVPPQQMVDHLRAGHLDGFCAGEPWGSLAVRAGAGIIAALSADLAPGHPEKVLAVRTSFADQRADEHAALVRALFAACQWCADPANHELLVELLASRHHLGLPPESIRPAITGEFLLAPGHPHRHPAPLIFQRGDSNEPTPARALAISRQLPGPVPPEIPGRVFRSDLFRSALRDQPAADLSHEHELAETASPAL